MIIIIHRFLHPQCIIKVLIPAQFYPTEHTTYMLAYFLFPTFTFTKYNIIFITAQSQLTPGASPTDTRCHAVCSWDCAVMNKVHEMPRAELYLREKKRV